MRSEDEVKDELRIARMGNIREDRYTHGYVEALEWVLSKLRMHKCIKSDSIDNCWYTHGKCEWLGNMETGNKECRFIVEMRKGKYG